MKTPSEDHKRLWVVYILRCSDGSFYTGVTNFLERRLKSHERGTASKYTRPRRPVALLAKSATMSRSEALRLEIKIKKTPREQKLAVLSGEKSRLRTGDSN